LGKLTFAFNLWFLELEGRTTVELCQGRRREKEGERLFSLRSIIFDLKSVSLPFKRQ
jgi:hypothetical protein